MKIARDLFCKPLVSVFILFVLLAFNLGSNSVARADASYELRTLYRDTRMKAMGGAGIALQLDDRDAVQGIFTNPAQMAGNQDLTLHFFGLDLAASWDTYTAIGDTMSAFSNFSFSSLNTLMGKNIYANAQVVSALTLPNFGAALIVDGQYAFFAKNQAYPEFTVGYQTTTGIQAAWGTSFDLGSVGGGGTSSGRASRSGGRRRPRTQSGRRAGSAGAQESVPIIGYDGVEGSEIRLGLGGKILWRRGGYKPLPLTDLLSADLSTLSRIAGNYETGYGLDAGLQYIRSLGPSMTLSLASSFMNIGDVDFVGSNSDTLPGNLSAGAALRYSLGGITAATLTYDQSFLFSGVDDWRKGSHLGVEWELPAISIYGGYNQSYLSYGASFDAWLFRVTATSYAEELGARSGQEANRRYLLRLATRISL
ncbi:MAG: hypothetical protein ACK5QT_06750 [Oligoflexia bacterium]